MKWIFVVTLIICGFLPLFAQDLVINELMSSNSSTIQDGDGEFPDWIEIFNNSSEVINLENMGLSDDADDPFKWQFPAIQLPADSFLIVFASSKDQTDYVAEWETIIDLGHQSAYLPINNTFDDNWINTTYDDSAWPKGATGIGYGDSDDATTISSTQCLYVRQDFTVPDVSIVKKMFLHIDFDDAFVAYLNGVEIARSNIGSAGTRPAYDDMPYEPREALMYQGGAPLAFDLNEFVNTLQNGSNVLAIELHNYGTSSSDMSLIPFLSLGYDQEKTGSQGANPILNLPVSALHTNFKISAAGEDIILTSASGDLIDIFEGDSLPGDYSKGRYPDGSESWFYYESATPGTANLNDGFSLFSPAVTASQSSGFYTSAFELILNSEDGTSTIYYTTDGTFPDTTSNKYSSAIPIDTNTVVRARIYKDRALPGPILNNSYFLNQDVSLPVISLITDPYNLWDEDYGIYVKGADAETDFPYFGSNFWQDWERPAHIQLFDTNENGFACNAGIKIFGGWSRGHNQKSMSVFFRGQYGTSELDYKLFEETPVDKFQAFVMRNSGNDWPQTMMRDGLTNRIVQGLDLDYQAFKPTVLFINGAFWGIHNVREKVNEHFIASHHNADADNIDMLENNMAVIHGDNEHYAELINYLENQDLNTPAACEYLCSKLDLNEFLNYYCTQIYLDNRDWPGNNIKYWRPKESTGKWRWILYDTDYGYSIFDHEAYKYNTLDFALEENGPGWPNPPWSTFLFRSLLKNDQIRYQFINRFAILLNKNFTQDYVVAAIDSLENNIYDEMPAHSERWGRTFDNWTFEVNRLRIFARNRVPYMRMYIQQEFDISGMGLLYTNVNDAEMGTVKVAGIEIEENSFTGNFFTGIPINIEAVAKPGYVFTGWSGDVESDEKNIIVEIETSIHLTASFEKENNDEGAICINEINYNSSDSFDSGDWIEIYNVKQTDLDCSGWVFKDSDDSHNFVFPQGTVIPADSYLVVCDDVNKFTALFPSVANYIGPTGFGLSGSGELVRLYDAQNVLIDSLVYDDKNPWPEEADGDGATIEVLNPFKDNALAENWAASSGHGTPGRMNSVYTGLDESRNEFIPTDLYLGQNYPNPFNPSTQINYSLPKAGFVELTVFNLLGQKVETLVNKQQQAGMYSTKLQMTNLSSGVYIYKFTFNNKTHLIKKMILLH